MALPDVELFLTEQHTKYLLCQRTDLIGKDAEAALRLYRKHIAKAMRLLSVHVPEFSSKARFLDIGCGLGFGLLVLKELFGSDHSFTGVDKDGIDTELRYGFQAEAEIYNDLARTSEHLQLNGISVENLELINLLERPFPIEAYDVVVSFLAYGWHFPISTYFDELTRIVKKQGVVYLDLRRRTNGLALMATEFDLVWAQANKKGLRTIWRGR